MISSTRRTVFKGLLAATALAALPAKFALAQDVPLPPDVVAFGGSIVAKGKSPKPLRIAILSYQGTAFWEATDVGIRAATQYLKALGTTVDYIQLGTAMAPEVAVAGLDGALAKQYEGVALVPVFDGTVSKVNEVVAAGVPVVAFIADSAERSNRTVAMGTLAYQAGQSAGAFILKQLDGKGKIAVITGYLGASQHNDRMNGALDMVKKQAPAVKIIGPFENKDDEATAYSQASDVMTSNPDLNLIYVTAGGPEGAAKAVRDAGMTGKVGVVAYDDLPSRQDYKDHGEFLALVDQSPARQAFDSLVMLHNMLAFKTTYPANVTIPSRLAYGKGAKL
jgi:ribose transport system substrate-binding protein